MTLMKRKKREKAEFNGRLKADIINLARKLKVIKRSLKSETRKI